MRELVFAMELHGRVAPVEGREGTMSGQTVGRGPLGETVRFTSQVVRQGETATKPAASNTLDAARWSSTQLARCTVAPAPCRTPDGGP